MGLALFIVTAAVANAWLVPPERAVSLRSAGYDFLAFYTAGTFGRTGETEKLYDLDAVRALQQAVARRHGLEMRPTAVGPFWNPPFYAWVFVPLSKLPYPTAWAVWTAFNIICLAAALAILASTVARAGRPCSEENATGCQPVPQDWKTWALVPLLTLTSAPLITSIGHGQNTCVSLLLLVGAVALWRGEKLFAAGAIAGLLFYKPQLGATVAAVMAVCCGWRALVGLATTGVALLLATVLTLPGTLEAFVRTMPANLAFMQVERPYPWDRHVTLKSFWRLLVQGYAAGPMSPLATALYVATAALLAACVIACVAKLRRNGDEISRDRIISITVLAMPLLMPFYFDYDLLLLAVPATLAAREALVRGSDRGVVAVWVAMYAWLMVNPHVAAATRVNGTVVLLTAATALTIARAMKRRAVEESTAAPAAAAAARHKGLRRRAA